MKRTESPVVDYDSDPVLKQIKAKFDTKEQAKEKAQLLIYKLQGKVLRNVNMEASVDEIDSNVVEKSDNPDDIDVCCSITVPVNFRKEVLKLLRNNAHEEDHFIHTLGSGIRTTVKLYFEQVVKMWRDQHPLLNLKWLSFGEYSANFRITRKTPPSLE